MSASKKSKESDHIQHLTLGDVAIIEEGKGQDNEARHDHIVDGLKVTDLEHHRHERLSEDESFLRSFFLLIEFSSTLLFLDVPTLL